MITVCDLRTDELSLSPQFGGQLLLLTHCTSERWGQIFPNFGSALPLTHQVVVFGSSMNELFETVPIEKVATVFDTHSVRHVLVPALQAQSLEAVHKLIDIVATLRSPDGCPWDRAQTPLSLTPYILEEAYEAVAAIRSNDIEHTVEELGDLLLQVVLQSQVFSESGEFTLAEVADTISSKLIRRHPHVFGPEATGSNTDIVEVKQRWEDIKQEEKAAETLQDKLVSYAKTFPPLLAATKITKKTAGMDGGNGTPLELMRRTSEQWDRLREMLESNRTETSDEKVRDAIGQLMFSLVQIGHHHGIKGTDALEQANWAAIGNLEEANEP